MSLFMILGLSFLLAASVLRGMMLYSARYMASSGMPFFGTPAVTAAMGIVSVILGLIGSFFVGRVHGVIIGVASFAGFWVSAAIWEPLIDASKK